MAIPPIPLPRHHPEKRVRDCPFVLCGPSKIEPIKRFVHRKLSYSLVLACHEKVRHDELNWELSAEGF